MNNFIIRQLQGVKHYYKYKVILVEDDVLSNDKHVTAILYNSFLEIDNKEDPEGHEVLRKPSQHP